MCILVFESKVKFCHLQKLICSFNYSVAQECIYLHYLRGKIEVTNFSTNSQSVAQFILSHKMDFAQILLLLSRELN